MKIKRKTIFVANDGNEFSTRAGCLEWENRKYRMSCNHLTDEQIVKLLEIIHYRLNGDDQPTTVRIDISYHLEQEDGFAYRVIIDSPDEAYKEHYSGIIYGTRDFKLCKLREDEITQNPALNYGFSLVKVYHYLDSIGFFAEKDVQPVENPNICRDWNPIFHRSFKGTAYN